MPYTFSRSLRVIIIGNTVRLICFHSSRITGLSFPIGRPKCIRWKWPGLLRGVSCWTRITTRRKSSKEVCRTAHTHTHTQTSYTTTVFTYGRPYVLHSRLYSCFIGPLLKKILDDCADKIVARSTHQLYAYAGHDSTVSNLLIALGVWDQQIPTYNMLTLIELHEGTGGKFYLKVFITIP